MFLSRTALDVYDERDSYWVVLRPLIFKSYNTGMEVVVPVGFLTNLASIPAPLRALIQVNGKHRYAAILHDYLYANPVATQLGSEIELTRHQCDRFFDEAMAISGVGDARRRMMYAGVRVGGCIAWSGHRNGPGDFMVPDKFREKYLGYLRL